MRFHLGTLSSILERRRAPELPLEQPQLDLTPLIVELRDIKSVLERHHQSRPTVSPS
jgi:hypothetical protein